jgi:cytochrome c oxidase cbb3-type subunit 3
MSSPCRNPDRRGWITALLGVAFALACVPAAKSASPDQPPVRGPMSVAITTLFPGGGQMPPADPLVKKYQGNAHAISDGARLFNWYNCSGCHFHGAGGMGPALMDNQWRSSWSGKIPANEVWEIAAYVKSLSAPSATTGGGEMPTPPAPPAAPSPTPQSAAPGAQSTPK